jgi:cob(I)alamin adenosyltransferase
LIQVYTGNGKGKTTAALGLALRAAGAGLKIYICQFLKGAYCCEHASLKKFKNIKIEQFGTRCFLRRKPAVKDIALANAGLKEAMKAVKACDVVILDEINVALKLKLITLKGLLNLIKSTPKKTELILTGRYAHPKIIKMADLVSEIKQRKHYYKKGIKGRKGIEF